MDQGHGKLRTVVDQGEKTVSHTSDTGAVAIRDQINIFKSEYDRLCSGVGEAKTDLDNVLEQWTSYEQTYTQLNNWLKDIEEKLKASGKLKTDLAEKKVQLEKAKVCYSYFS